MVRLYYRMGSVTKKFNRSFDIKIQLFNINRKMFILYYIIYFVIQKFNQQLNREI